MRHGYATAMLMAGMMPAFCAKQLGHSVEMFLTTYSKWIDGSQNDIERGRLEAAISSPDSSPEKEVRAKPLMPLRKFWWARRGSNPRPIDYESTALTAELQALI